MPGFLFCLHLTPTSCSRTPWEAAGHGSSSWVSATRVSSWLSALAWFHSSQCVWGVNPETGESLFFSVSLPFKSIKQTEAYKTKLITLASRLVSGMRELHVVPVCPCLRLPWTRCPGSARTSLHSVRPLIPEVKASLSLSTCPPRSSHWLLPAQKPLPSPQSPLTHPWCPTTLRTVRVNNI